MVKVDAEIKFINYLKRKLRANPKLSQRKIIKDARKAGYKFNDKKIRYYYNYIINALENKEKIYNNHLINEYKTQVENQKKEKEQQKIYESLDKPGNWVYARYALFIHEPEMGPSFVDYTFARCRIKKGENAESSCRKYAKKIQRKMQKDGRRNKSSLEFIHVDLDMIFKISKEKGELY